MTIIRIEVGGTQQFTCPECGRSWSQPVDDCLAYLPEDCPFGCGVTTTPHGSFPDYPFEENLHDLVEDLLDEY